MCTLRLKTKSTLAEHILIEFDAKSRFFLAGPLNGIYMFEIASKPLGAFKIFHLIPRRFS